jgi:hypothetical protein
MPQRLNTEPVGVFKASFANAIAAAAQFATGPGQPIGQPFVPGRPMGYLSPSGVDPQADVLGWVARSDRGEPYTDDGIRSVIDMMGRFHSAYGIDSSVAPPPLFVGAGFTDDLFPVDETVRYVERLRRLHPGVPVSLYFGDFGHQRAANKPADRDRLLAAIREWFDAYVKRGSEAPAARPAATGVIATTQTCPRSAASEGPFTAPTFSELARGEVRFSSRSPQTVAPTGGDPQVAAAIDPAAGGGDGCRSTGVADAAGTAVYSLPAATGYTLLGAPTISARLRVTGDAGVPQLALRLWDVSDGSQTLVARGLYRPTGKGTEVFQLHPNGWQFAPGHVARLEVLGSDPPYARPSNGRFEVTIESLALTLPVRDEPDCRTIQPVAAPAVPPGQSLAVGIRPGKGCDAAAKPALRLRLRCTKRRVTATATVTGATAKRIDFLVGKRRVARDTKPPFARTMRRRSTRLVARAVLRGHPSVRAAANCP